MGIQEYIEAWSGKFGPLIYLRGNDPELHDHIPPALYLRRKEFTKAAKMQVRLMCERFDSDVQHVIVRTGIPGPMTLDPDAPNPGGGDFSSFVDFSPTRVVDPGDAADTLHEMHQILSGAGPRQYAEAAGLPFDPENAAYSVGPCITGENFRFLFTQHPNRPEIEYMDGSRLGDSLLLVCFCACTSQTIGSQDRKNFTPLLCRY